MKIPKGFVPPVVGGRMSNDAVKALIQALGDDVMFYFLVDADKNMGGVRLEDGKWYALAWNTREDAEAAPRLLHEKGGRPIDETEVVFESPWKYRLYELREGERPGGRNPSSGLRRRNEADYPRRSSEGCRLRRDRGNRRRSSRVIRHDRAKGLWFETAEASIDAIVQVLELGAAPDVPLMDRAVWLEGRIKDFMSADEVIAAVNLLSSRVLLTIRWSKQPPPGIYDRSVRLTTCLKA